jgi:hypothetical protein
MRGASRCSHLASRSGRRALVGNPELGNASADDRDQVGVATHHPKGARLDQGVPQA